MALLSPNLHELCISDSMVLFFIPENRWNITNLGTVPSIW